MIKETKVWFSFLLSKISYILKAYFCVLSWLMRYKILFISSWFPNKLEPTNGNFVQRHAEAVSQLHDVEILHSIGDSMQKETYLFDDKIINRIRTVIVYYKNSKNPRLTVEIALMQLASLTAIGNGDQKKSSWFSNRS